jgi:hypothetical protein
MTGRRTRMATLIVVDVCWRMRTYADVCVRTVTRMATLIVVEFVVVRL